MIVYMDEDVKKVIAFMSQNMVASKLISVAKAVNDLALPLWGHYESENIIPISVLNDPILACDRQIQSVANE